MTSVPTDGEANLGEVVTREELCRVLWANNTIVDFDQSINAAIERLRIALGDSADKPVYVETLAHRGYRLIVPVQWKELPHVGRERGTEPETINRRTGLCTCRTSAARLAPKATGWIDPVVLSPHGPKVVLR